MYFNGQGTLNSNGAAGAGASSEAFVDSDSFRALLTSRPAGFSFFSPGVFGCTSPIVAVLKSNAVPGVFGVLLEPNEANAPDPRPKADEPAVVGEARPGPTTGDMALKGLRPPCDEESPPKRLLAEKVRWGASGFSLDVERESLLVLRWVSVAIRGGGREHTYLERRVHRFSLLSIGN